MKKNVILFAIIFFVLFIASCKEPNVGQKKDGKKGSVPGTTAPVPTSSQNYPAPKTPEGLLAHATELQGANDHTLITEIEENFLKTDEFKALDAEVQKIIEVVGIAPKDMSSIVKIFNFKRKKLELLLAYGDKVSAGIKTQQGWDEYLVMRSKIIQAIQGAKELVAYIESIPKDLRESLKDSKNLNETDEGKAYLEKIKKITTESHFDITLVQTCSSDPKEACKITW